MNASWTGIAVNFAVQERNVCDTQMGFLYVCHTEEYVELTEGSACAINRII